MFSEFLERAKTFLAKSASFVVKEVCAMGFGDNADTYLNAGIYLKLCELAEAGQFGMTYFRITPFQLGSTATRLIERELNGKLRKVTIVVDSAVGGATPTIRFGNSSVVSGNGGVRLNAGIFNELGEVAPDAELWAASNVAIAGYTIERA